MILHDTAGNSWDMTISEDGAIHLTPLSAPVIPVVTRPSTLSDDDLESRAAEARRDYFEGLR